MKNCVLFFIFLFISCSETVIWNVELKNCTFEFQVLSNEETAEIKYLFMKNLDNSSVTYNFLCEKAGNTFFGEVISGKYFAVCYFLVAKTVNKDVKFYAQAYYADEIVLSADCENKRNIEPTAINVHFREVRCESDNIRIDIDLSNDFFLLYKISAFSVKNGGKNKSYDYFAGSSYYFYDVDCEQSKLTANLSYSVKNYCDKNFLLEHGIKLTTTRFDNLDISGLIK